MKEQLVSFETAKLAKEKGFEETCHYYYDFDVLEFEDDNTILPILNSNYCEIKSVMSTPYYDLGQNIPEKEVCYYATPDSALKSVNKEEKELDPNLDDEGIITVDAPTQSLLQKWLREIYRIDVIILPNTSSNDVFLSIIPSKTYSNFLWKDLESMDTISNNYKTYEEALEVGLQEGLKLIL